MTDEAFPTGKELENKLYKGKLPQMVDWFDPLVLGMVAVRSLISTTIGAYADQRPMQQAMDDDRGPKLTRRHDYGTLDKTQRLVLAPEGDPDNPNCDDRCNPAKEKVYQQDRIPRHLQLDATGALWVDFIADLGD